VASRGNLAGRNSWFSTRTRIGTVLDSKPTSPHKFAMSLRYVIRWRLTTIFEFGIRLVIKALFSALNVAAIADSLLPIQLIKVIKQRIFMAFIPDFL